MYIIEGLNEGVDEIEAKYEDVYSPAVVTVQRVARLRSRATCPQSHAIVEALQKTCGILNSRQLGQCPVEQHCDIH